MPQRKKKRPTYRHEEAMQAPNEVTVCVRMPHMLHDKLIEMQARHMRQTGKQVSRNTLILSILSRRIESGRGVEI